MPCLEPAIWNSPKQPEGQIVEYKDFAVYLLSDKKIWSQDWIQVGQGQHNKQNKSNWRGNKYITKSNKETQRKILLNLP